VSGVRRKTVATALLILLGLAAVVWFAQRGLIYFPSGDVPSVVDAGLPQAEPIAFETADGLRLEGWFVPAVPPATGYTAIVFNGNAGHRGYRADLAQGLASRGIASLLFDYRGYGGNPGLPSERGLAHDARGALAYLKTRPDVDRSRIVYYGESLGAAVAIGLAVEEAPAALILRSPFASLAAMARVHYPVLPARWLLRDRYPSIDRIPAVRSPLLVIAGDADQIVPIEQSSAIHEAATGRKRLVIVEHADHNDPELTAGPAMIQAVADFLGGR
jgi:fermentation-respiration switch protein FrsA (DUF1100 family)